MIRPASPFLAFAGAALLPTGSVAVEPDWRRAGRPGRRFLQPPFRAAHAAPEDGEPIVLDLRNSSKAGHGFMARDFFVAAAVRAAGAAKIRDGAVDLGGGRSAEIGLVPRAGRHPLRCSHIFHAALGIKGNIAVE